MISTLNDAGKVRRWRLENAWLVSTRRRVAEINNASATTPKARELKQSRRL